MSDNQPFVEPKIKYLHKNDRQYIKLTYIIHFYFDQKSPNTLLDLLKKYETYNKNILDYLQFIIIDDCSPLQFNIPDFNLNITWLKITDNITWNQGGARNLGVTYAKSDKILLCDLDYEFPEHTLQYMMDRKNPGNSFYKIKKKNSKKGHPNTFFLSRARFLRLYGYDEEYCGGYGAEDYRFVKFLKYHGTWQKYLPRKYYCVVRDDIDRDKNYHSLNRNFDRNTPIDRRKRSELLQWGAEKGHSRIFLNFTWEIIKTSHRGRADIIIKSNFLWKKLWLFRTLFKRCN
jgi:hypothetical protein